MFTQTAKLAKLRFVHIPKTAGTALSHTIYEAMGLRPNFITESIGRKPGERTPPHFFTLETGAVRFARNNLFLHGHVAFSTMKRLDGDFIFSVLREPRQRLMSHYTYMVSRLLRDGDTEAPARHSFQDFMRSGAAGNIMFHHLCGDLFARRSISDDAFAALDVEAQKKLIASALRRFNAIYFAPLQDVLDDLAARNLIPACRASVRNRTEADVVLGNMGLRASFLELVNANTACDRLVVEAAVRLFPALARDRPLGDEAFLRYVEERFDCKFESEI